MFFAIEIMNDDVSTAPSLSSN